MQLRPLRAEEHANQPRGSAAISRSRPQEHGGEVAHADVIKASLVFNKESATWRWSAYLEKAKSLWRF